MKRSSSSSRISSSRSSSSRSSSSRPSSGGSSSMRTSGGAASLSGARMNINPFAILVLFIIVIVLVVIYAALMVDWKVALVLFIASIAGILINAAIGKPELTPEDKNFEATIVNYPTPSTREALLEFAMEATPKIKPVGKLASMFSEDAKRQIWLNGIWTEKCRKIYTKASIAMQGDRKSLDKITELMNNAGIKI